MLLSERLSPALRQLKDCRHSLPSRGSRSSGCYTCRLAAKVMKDIEKEQRAAEDLQRQKLDTTELSWARARRDILLMRHPTYWAGCSLMQGPRPGRPVEPEPEFVIPTGEVDVKILNDHEAGNLKAAARISFPRHDSHVHGNDHGSERGWVGVDAEDSRPKLIPGAMLTLAHLTVEAIMVLTKEVLGDEDSRRRPQKAMSIVMAAISEVAFSARRDHPRTGILVTKLQAMIRGWLARRLARALILRGGCRRELDAASGAWLYVWGHQPSFGAAVFDGKRVYGDGEGSFRSWYPPALLKAEVLPSPRAALRRVEGEEKMREARLMLSNQYRNEQRAMLDKREARAVRLLALAEVVKLVERATISLECAADSCFGIDSKPPLIAVRVMHPRGGEPGDAAREAVASEIMAAWHQIAAHAREQAEALRLMVERAASDERGKSPRQTSRSRRGGERKTKHSPHGVKGGKREAKISVPTANDNLVEFEQRLLKDSLYQGAPAAVASLLQRKRLLVAAHEASRLERNNKAWEKQGTSPMGLGIQVFPPWACASHRFIALAHRGRLVAVSQASPFVFWESLVKRENARQLLRGILRPFLDNKDLLQAMFVGSRPSRDGVVAGADTTAARRPTTKAGGIRGGDPRAEGEWRPPPSAVAPAASAATSSATEGKNGNHHEVGCEPAADGESLLWGYRSSVSSKGCWKVDAWAAARRDDSVELAFDSVAFDVFVRPVTAEGAEGETVGNSTARDLPAAVVTNAVPFRLADGLPRELGPLLFDESAVELLIAGAPKSRIQRASQPVVVAGLEGPDLQAGERLGEKEEGDKEEVPWVRINDKFGQVLSHVHLDDPTEEAGVEVRIRGQPCNVETLASAGVLQEDVSALVMTADIGASTATTRSKGLGGSGGGEHAL